MSATQSRVKHADVLPRLDRVATGIEDAAGLVRNEGDCLDVLARIRQAAADLKWVEDRVLGQHVESCVAAAAASGDAAERDRKIAEILALIGSPAGETPV